MEYRYDVFVSYRRSDLVQAWVHNLLVPRLKDYLPQHGAGAGLFLDQGGVDAGAAWPDTIRGALATARVFLPVLEAEYFTRDWCREEFEAAWARRLSLGLDVIVPVWFHDGHAFDPRANVLQMEDFRRWCGLRRRSAMTRELDRKIDALAATLARRAAAVPPWSPLPDYAPPRSAPAPVVPEPRWTR